MELPFPSSHTKPKRQIHFRNVKNINMDALALDLQHLSSGSTDSLSVADSVNLYNQSLSSLLDLHAPLTSRSELTWDQQQLLELVLGADLGPAAALRTGPRS
ncbi:unnamed protein product [Boreogadus saida]